MDTNLQKYQAFVAAVEQGLGISILPQLILQKIPYKVLSSRLKSRFTGRLA